MIKWLEKKFHNMGKQKAISESKEEKVEEKEVEIITLECEGDLSIRVEKDDDNYSSSFHYYVFLDYNINIYFEDKLESINATGTLYTESLDSEMATYKFVVEQYENGVKDYMEELEKNITYKYRKHLSDRTIDELKHLVNQQKPIKVEFKVKVAK